MIPGGPGADAAVYRSIFLQSCVPTMVLAASGHGLVVVEANPAAARLLGREEGSLIGLTGTDAVSPDDRARIVEAGRALTAGEVDVWRDEIALTGLEPRWVNVTLSPLPGTAPRPLLLAQLVDCTAVRTAHGLVESVLDATTGTAIIGTDPGGSIVFFNTGAERMLGYRADEVVGRLAPELLHDPEELAERAGRLGMPTGYAAVVAPVSHGAGTDRREWTYVRADGRRLPVSVSVSPMRGPSGTEAGFLAVAEDVSEYRRAEAMLQEALVREREAVERLHALDRAKTDFVSSVSHELRTPLTTVLGFTEVLQSGAAGELTERQTSMLTRVEQNGRRLLVLIEDLLTLSTLEAGTFRLERREVDLGALVHRSLHPVDSLLRGRDLDLHVSLPPEPVRVSGDPDQLARVVTNLVTNAVKFTPDGGRISVHVECDDEGGVLRVTDTGMGVPVAEQGQLFSRFFRSAGAYDRAIPGTGLGLSVVKSIVDEHDGSVSLRSHPGEGAEFTVRLPVA
ncbi:MAG: ATP-binding protein [Nocardioides sp.]